MKEKISKKQLREFGVTVGIGFPLLIGYLVPYFAGHGFKLWTLFVGVPGIILALIAPFLLVYPYKVWMGLGYFLGWFNSRLVLGLVYCLILLPISLLMRFTGYDPLKKRFNGETSYRENRKDHRTNLTRIF